MNIAIFTDSYHPQINGVVTQIKNMTNEFLSRGHRVMIVAPSDSIRFSHNTTHHGRLLEFFLPSVSLPTYKDYRVTHFLSPRIFSELREFGPNIVHVHTPFSVGWLGINCAKKIKVPVVGTYHTLLPEFLAYLPIPFLKDTILAKRLAWGYTNFFYNSCGIVTTPTGQMKGELERNGLEAEVVALPNAIDFALFNRFAGKKPKHAHSAKTWGGGLKLIYFGRVSYEKNIEVLLHALKELRVAGSKATLTITGSGPASDYLQRIAGEEHLSGAVLFQAALKDKELARHVAGHDAFVTASTIETQGLTILEAMAAGLPCIGADYLGIKDSIKEGFNGFLFKPYDFHELADKIEKLESPSLRKKLGKNAVETARKYSLQSVADETEKLYRRVMKK